jgi:hypothetical protein
VETVGPEATEKVVVLLVPSGLVTVNILFPLLANEETEIVTERLLLEEIKVVEIMVMPDPEKPTVAPFLMLFPVITRVLLAAPCPKLDGETEIPLGADPMTCNPPDPPPQVPLMPFPPPPLPPVPLVQIKLPTGKVVEL